jgi:hypothetical protein
MQPDAPFCGIDMPVNDDGWWVNRTLVCPEGDPSCFQNLVYCSEVSTLVALPKIHWLLLL